MAKCLWAIWAKLKEYQASIEQKAAVLFVVLVATLQRLCLSKSEVLYTPFELWTYN